jgi:hypothetical protein
MGYFNRIRLKGKLPIHTTLVLISFFKSILSDKIKDHESPLLYIVCLHRSCFMLG